MKTICYARVSSDHQKEDLGRQIKLLQDSYPESEIIKDIGSGLNFKRKGLEALLEQISSKNVRQVVVTFKDRMCRFGFELIEWIFKKYNVEFVVLNKLSNIKEDIFGTSELAEDLIAITTIFVARNNGKRSAMFRKQRKEKEKKEEEESEEE